mmetsp:Transcript_31802/g.53140  ORF Transcript_31802/g.53140 Transcript_31802/m.53140 type:complete len:204 (+) Transcript_31802:370-981(+)
MAQLRHGLEQSHKELHQAVAELGQERQLSRQRHAGLVECLTGTIQARDAALGALKRLEMFCHEHGWDIHDLAIYETLRAEILTMPSGAQGNTVASLLDQQQHFQPQGGGNTNLNNSTVVNNLMRGLVEADHDLFESERRMRHYQQQQQQQQWWDGCGVFGCQWRLAKTQQHVRRGISRQKERRTCSVPAAIAWAAVARTHCGW